MSATAWSCEAYGDDPELREIGAMCFRSAGPRVCQDLAECGGVMAAERRRVFSRIQELAAGGDPVAVYLAEEFTSPDQLLNAPLEPPGSAT